MLAVQAGQEGLADYRPLVYQVAHRMRAGKPACVELDDLVQAGMIGLIEAEQRFEPSHGATFVGYACSRIQGAMLDVLRGSDWLTRRERKLRKDVDQAVCRLQHRHLRNPSAAEIAKELGLASTDSLQRSNMDADSGPTSLNELMSGDPPIPEEQENNELRALEINTADFTADPSDVLQRQQMQRALTSAIASLPQRQQYALNAYYAHDLTRIFEPFVRLPYKKGSVDGIGLGLAIVKQTADLIKAPLEVESVVGEGTTFHLTLPRCEDLQAAAAPAKDNHLRGVRIVVVDNDEIVLESMARTLEEWGCRVIAACDWNGLEAKLEMTSSPIDLILTDFHLDAGLSGYELIKRVRKRLGVQIPSILLTGDVEIRHGPESTATAVVIAYKPLPYEKLANLIQETISSYARVEPPPD